MDMLISMAPLLCIFVVLFLMAMGISWFSYKSGAKRYLAPLLPLINGEVKVPVFGQSFLEGVWEGKKVKVIYAPASKYCKERIIIYYSSSLPVAATISRKNLIDKVMDRFRPACACDEVKFDSKYIVRSNDDTKTRIFLNQKRRGDVERIFNLITFGLETIPPIESAKDKQVLKILEGNISIVELTREQIILKHYVVRAGLPDADAIQSIVKGILKAMKDLAG